MPLSRMVLVFPEPCPPKAGSWCSCYERRPHVRLTVLGNGPRRANGLGPWIRSNWRPFDVPVMRPLDQALVMWGLLGVHSRCGLHTRAVTVIRDPLSEGFSHFVSSMPAPVASGWSESPGGPSPTGKRRLF